jgi:hypothetical protein
MPARPAGHRTGRPGNAESVAWDERTWGAGQAHSTRERAEQSHASGCGGAGGKGPGQGEHRQHDTSRAQDRTGRQNWAGPTARR